MRQSAGKRVKNKLAAACVAQPVKPCSANPWSAAWPWAARIRNPAPLLLLLKTASSTRQADETFCRALPTKYSRAVNPMQRGYRTSNQMAAHFVTACVRPQPVRAPESYARHSPGDSNAHSGPLAATKTEAHVSRRIREDGSDMLHVLHIPGNGIPRKTGSRMGWERESQNTSWTELFLALIHSNSHYDVKLRIKAESAFKHLCRKTVALVKLVFGMLRCAVAVTVNRP